MSGNLSGYVNVIPVLSPTCGLAAQGSDYIKMDQYEKVMFVVTAGSGMSDSGAITAALWSALTATGSGAAVVGVYTTIGAATTNHSVTRASAIVIDNASSWAESIVADVTINGITYSIFSTSRDTGAIPTTATFNATRYICTSSLGGGADGSAEHLAAYINHDTYGVPNVFAIKGGNPIASASDHNVYVTGLGNAAITVAGVVAASSDLQVWPVKYAAVLETDAAEIASVNSSHKYVSVILTCSSAVNVTALAIRSGGRYKYSSTGDLADVGVTT